MARGGWREFETGPPARDRPAAIRPAAQQRVRVQRSSRGRGGKTITTITGVELPAAQLKVLAKTLKIATGTGGTVQGDVIELQGDQVQKALEQLTALGYRPRRSGG